MVCDSIDFDFSDYHPHGLSGRFALDTPFLQRPWPNFCFPLCAPTASALQGLDLMLAVRRTACTSTQHAARRVLDTTRDWLQNSPSPEQMR